MSRLSQKIDLICPAGNLPALRAAVDNGADAIYIGFRDGTNARNFPGLNFSHEEARRGRDYARQNGVSIFLAMNTYPQAEQWQAAIRAINMAAEIEVDALILADPGLMNYCKKTHPGLRLHLSVQASATNRDAICFYHEKFNIQRVVLPRVLSLSQVRQVIKEVPVEVEVFGFGSLCVMVEGRCALSSYVTGESPNTAGVCSPAHAVRWKETAEGRQSYLNNVLIERYNKDEPAGYPTLCKGRFYVEDNLYHAIEEPTSLNLLELLPDLMACGVKAIKVEGRQRSKAYVSQVTRILRQALDACFSNPDDFVPNADWIAQLNMLAEGSCHTLGAYHRPWQ
ncbi:MAG: U32 family peptidase [Gammaproteobacteria bacterium]|nr:MAG: U32 family peptidase [Gammaproteobacteria bacterium]RKZ71621.1 MAG: U32 family peptidase [Gammaproteobacteria bacterium]